MLWLPIAIAIAAFAAIIGVVVYQRFAQRDTNLVDVIGMPVFTFVAILVYGVGLCDGYFITHFASPTLATWSHALWVRAAWQVGGGVLVFFGVLVAAREGGTLDKPAVWIMAAVLAALGPWAALNSIRDLRAGPAVFTLTGGEVAQWRTTRGSKGIRARLNLRGQDGAPVDIDLAGWDVNLLQGLVASCPKDARRIEVTVLRHMEKVLAVRCE